MKVAVLMGKGLEGCGVSKYSIELCKYLEKNNHEYTLIASKDKNWSRSSSHVFKNLIHLKFALKESVQIVTDICNSSDLVIINSLPAKPLGATKGHDAEVGKSFIEILSKIKAPVISIQHDHNKLSIIRNDALKETIERSDMLFSHAPDNDFVREIKNMFPETGGLSNFFDESPSTKKIEFFNFQPGMYFDEVREKYWKPINDVNKNIHRWIGRTTFWKGFELMFKFAPELKAKNAITILEGIEKSPAYIQFKEKYQYVDYVTTKINTVDVSKHAGDKPLVFTLFNNADMLERMSTSGYGYQLSIIDPRYIKHSIEYTHCEIASVGCIPVFRKEYGDACIHRVTGNPMSVDDNGTLWLNEDSISEVSSMIDKLNSDDVLRDEYRNKAFEYYKAHQDADKIFSELFSTIKNELRINIQ